LKEYLPRTAGGVAHCFTADLKEAREYLDMGLYIGITGWLCDERRGQHLRDVVKHLPLDRMLIETDAPYLLPRDMQPKPKSRRNEPAFLPHVLHTIAQLRGATENEIASATSANACHLFGWPDRH
jgi:TatD DNase family protein